MTIPLACTQFCNGIWDRFPFGPLIDVCATVLPSLGKLRLPEVGRVPLRAGDRIRRPSAEPLPPAGTFLWVVTLVGKPVVPEWPSLFQTPAGMPSQQR